jgi:hypothetical protein
MGGRDVPGPVAAPRGTAWRRVMCEGCGLVASVPMLRADPAPWCPHSGTVTWKVPGPETQAGPRPWRRMVVAEARRT